MRLKLKYLGVLFLMVLLLIALGCQQKQAKQEPKPETETEEELAQPTRKNPLVVDTDNNEVLIYTEVNGKYFSEWTRHGVVSKDGSNGDKSVLRAWANALKLHDALISIEAKPGDNVKLDSPIGTIVEGDTLEVKVSWDGKTYDFEDIIKSEPDRGMEVRFGGNYQTQSEKKTGCLLCLDSCAAGITSNAKWEWGATHTENKVKFYGREDILPPDGSPVIVSFSLK